MRLPITVAPIKAKRKTIFSKGDTVRVVEGDLRHLMGVVESVDEEMVTIMPKHQDLHELLSFPSHQLQKFFKDGDHCKVFPFFLLFFLFPSYHMGRVGGQ
jgi:transcription elongation factor SPT5